MPNDGWVVWGEYFASNGWLSKLEEKKTGDSHSILIACAVGRWQRSRCIVYVCEGHSSAQSTAVRMLCINGFHNSQCDVRSLHSATTRTSGVVSYENYLKQTIACQKLRSFWNWQRRRSHEQENLFRDVTYRVLSLWYRVRIFVSFFCFFFLSRINTCAL